MRRLSREVTVAGERELKGEGEREGKSNGQERRKRRNNKTKTALQSELDTFKENARLLMCTTNTAAQTERED